ncbi:MAG: hypothetical protein GX592_14040, partial [Clostridiales bacterium]|nr:hypothetical protein [Clostridiales bacterium]
SYYATIKVNVAVAANSSGANAYIAGAGAITAKKVTVTATGEAYAEATVYRPNVSGGMANIAANAMAALLSATQKAYIQDITIHGTSASVTSELNKDKAKGASATLGSNGGNGSASLAGVNSKANSAVATANATGGAQVIAANLTLTGALTIYAKGDSYANSTVANDVLTASAIGIGVNVLYAYAKGGFNATASGNIEASGITIDSTYRVNANAVSAQPNWGARLELVSIQGNVAYAETNASSTSGVDGAGTIKTGALSATANGTAKATADIQGVNLNITGVSLAVNVVSAVVSGTQKAILKDANVTALSVTVTSNFNTGSSTNNYAATATVGSNSGNATGISLVGGKTSSAKASVTAKVSAEVLDAVLTSVAGAVNVTTNAKSYALAQIREQTVTVSLVNVSLIFVEADAAGTFTASMKAGAGKSSVGSVNVKSIYTVYSIAKTGAAGGLNASLVDANYNEAKANTSVSGNAGFGSDGDLTVLEDVLVSVEATADAIAEVKSPRLSISGVKVAVNKVTANLNAQQNAYAFGTGSATVFGKVEILSKLNVPESGAGTHGAKATVRGPAGSLSLIAASTNSAYANSSSVNTGYIADIDLSSKSVEVHVQTINLANARAENGTSVSLTAFGNLYAESYTADKTVAKISGGKVTATDGSVDLDAESNLTSYALATAGGSAALVSATLSEAKAYVGKSTKKQVAEVFIADGAIVKAEIDVDLYAYNTGYAEAVIQKGGTFAIGTIESSSLPTSSYYDTYAGVKDNCTVTAGRHINIRAKDYTRARSEAKSSSIGVVVSVSTTYGSNTIDCVMKVGVGASKLFATENVLIQADSNAYMYALTHANSDGGFYNGSTMQAKNSLTRAVTADILAGADIEADFGTLTIKAVGGAEDDITTTARVESTGFVAIGDTRTYTDVSTTATANIAIGAKLKNTFGYVKVYADASINRAYAYSHVYNSGVGNEPDAKALGTLTLTSKVNLGSTGTGKLDILGKNVDIRSYIGKLNFFMQSYSRGRGLGVNVDSESRTHAYITSEVNLTNATVRGYDVVVIQAEARPAWRSAHIINDAYSFAQGIGDATAIAELGSSYTKTNVYLKGGTDVHGAKVTVDALQFNANVNQYPHTRRTGIASASDDRNGGITNTRTMDIATGVGFHIGDAAVGIAIDISERGIRQVGLPKENMNLFSVSGDTVTILPLANPLPGTLYLGAHTGTGYIIYNQRFIPEVLITNRTDKNLEITRITVENANFINPSVSGGHGFSRADSTNQTPTIIVENRLDGDVHVSDLISDRTGTTIFRWIGETGGNLTSARYVTVISAAGAKAAPIWTHVLTIENAANIGTGADSRFAAFLFLLGTAEGVLNAQTSGWSYMQLTPVRFIEKDTQAEVLAGNDTSAFAPTLKVMTLLAVGDNDLLLSEGIRIYNLKGSTVITMPLPGTLEYVSGTMKGLTANATIDAEGLERYLQGYNIANEAYVYLLPNGTTLYINAQGEIVRVTELVGSTEVNTTLKDYSFTYEGSDIVEVGLGTGVSLDLLTGELTLKAGANFQTLLSVIDANWLIGNVDTGAGQFKFTYSVITGTEVIDGVTVPKAEFHEVNLVLWKSAAGSDYYWLQNRQVSWANIMDEDEDEMYLLKKTGDTLEAFVIGGEGEVEEQVGTSEDSLVYYYDGNGNRVTVDQGMADLWKSKGDYWYGFAQSMIGTLVLDYEYPSSSVQYVGIDNFLGISGLTIKYRISDGKWFYRGAVDSGFGWYNEEYRELPVTQINGAYHVAAGTQLNDVYLNWNSKRNISIQDDFFYAHSLVTDWEDNGGYISIANDGTHWATNGGPYLNDYELTVRYTKMRAASILITPANPEDEDTYYHVGIYASENNNSYADIDGPIKDIPIKLTALPSNDFVTGNGYRIHDLLYISTGGKVLMLVDNDKNGVSEFNAAYDGSTYQSDFMTISNVGAHLNSYTGLSEAIQPVIMLLAGPLPGQPVTLERLTDVVAVDVQGRYWYYDGTNWNLAAAEADGAKTLVKYGRVTYLTIETIGDILYFTLPNGIRVGSDGSVVSSGTAGQTQNFVKVTGLKYLLGMLAGDNVIITMPDAHGSLE